MVEPETRTATWLELFYDLAYVAVIAKMVHHLPEYTNDLPHYFMGLVIFILIGGVGLDILILLIDLKGMIPFKRLQH